MPTRFTGDSSPVDDGRSLLLVLGAADSCAPARATSGPVGAGLTVNSRQEASSFAFAFCSVCTTGRCLHSIVQLWSTFYLLHHAYVCLFFSWCGLDQSGMRSGFYRSRQWSTNNVLSGFCFPGFNLVPINVRPTRKFPRGTIQRQPNSYSEAKQMNPFVWGKTS